MTRSIIIPVLLVSILVTAPQASFASVRSATPTTFCAKAYARFIPRHVDLGGKVDVNAGAYNCSTERERVPMTWRISGPCHPHAQGSELFILHRSESVVLVFGFRPPCAGQYRLAVKVFHGTKLVDSARDYLRVTAG
jgi:hypothetical protein